MTNLLWPGDHRAGEHMTDPHRLPIPADLAAGRYRIAVGLYDPDNGQRLPVLDAQGRPMADRVIIGEVDVGPK